MLWFFLGVVYLAYLTWKDYRDNMVVPEWVNYFMMGLTTGLFYIYHVKWFMTIALLVGFLFLKWLNEKKQWVGSADLASLAWAFFGFGIMNLSYLLIFLLCFCSTYLLYILLNRLLKKQGLQPFYPVILLSFTITGIIVKLY